MSESRISQFDMHAFGSFLNTNKIRVNLTQINSFYAVSRSGERFANLEQRRTLSVFSF